jgi:basic amino acid/polyamine antiporter, APA family
MAPESASSGPMLQRRLGVWSSSALVVSNMIGTGIFTTTGFLAGDLGEAWLVLAVWVVGGGIALAGALCYAELGINIVKSGGEYAYLTRAFGPVWGFLSGWVSFFAGFSAPIAAAALAFSGYLAFIFPSLSAASRMYSRDFAGVTWEVGPMQVIAASLVMILAVLNCLPVSQVARVQNVLTTIKIVVIGAFVVLGPAVGQGNWSNLAGSAERTSSTPLVEQFAVSLFWVMFGYAGWNAATYVAEEIEEPRRTLPRALMFGTLAVVILYFALNVVFIFAVRVESLKGVVAVGALAATAMFGPQAAWLFSLLMALAIVSTVNAMTTIGPRVYYEFRVSTGACLVPPGRYVDDLLWYPIEARNLGRGGRDARGWRGSLLWTRGSPSFGPAREHARVMFPPGLSSSADGTGFEVRALRLLRNMN